MGFFDQLKKTIWDSFFGKPEPSKKKTKPRRSSRKAAPKKASLARKSLKPSRKSNASKLLKVNRSQTKGVVRKAIQSSKSVSPILPNRQKSKPDKKIKRVASAPPKAKAVKPKLEGVLVGCVTHFFPQVNAAAIKITAQSLSVGDVISIKGATTQLKVKITSMQINRVPVTQASKGSEIGILVKKRVREGDQVFKL